MAVEGRCNQVAQMWETPAKHEMSAAGLGQDSPTLEVIQCMICGAA